MVAEPIFSVGLMVVAILAAATLVCPGYYFHFAVLSSGWRITVFEVFFSGQSAPTSDSSSGCTSVPSSGVTRKDAWRAFFTNHRAISKVLSATIVGLMCVWVLWPENVGDKVAQITQSGDDVAAVFVLLAMVLTIFVVLFYILGRVVFITVVKEFAVMHGIAQIRVYKFGPFRIKKVTNAMERWLEHSLFPSWLGFLHYMFSKRAGMAVLAIMITMIVLFVVVCGPNLGLKR